MEIRCRCSACRAKLRIAEKHAGKTVRCPRCSGPVEVPALEAAETAADANAPPKAVTSEVVAPPPAIPGGPPLAPAAPPPEPPPPPIVAPHGAEPDNPFPAIEVHAARGALRDGKVGTARGRAASSRGRQSSLLPLVVAGGILLLAGGVLIGLFLSADSQQPDATAVGSASGQGTLVFAWPENERREAALLIDGRHAGIAGTGELRYDLRAGSHAILIERRGYEPFTSRVTLRGGATEQISPTWKVAADAPTTATSTSRATEPLGGEAATASPAVRGFDGWLTNFDVARKQAAADKKELAIVFGCSDAQPATQELARALQEPSANNALANTVRVVIDIPRAPTNRDQAAESRRLMQEFGLTRLPVLVLADEQARPYALEKRWEYGFERLTDKLDAWQKQRIDRDRLLAAAEKGSEADRIGNATVTVKWLQEQGVWMFYRPEIRKWFELAERLDPKNEQHLLEALFEPQWLSRVAETNVNDAADVLRVAEELQPWISRKFDDADRGARLHMAAARLLTDARKFEEAALHMEQAIKYQPRDARLADAVRHVRQLLDNKDVLGSGTGFLVSAGYVVTNQHVVDGPGQVAIRIPGEKETIAAELVAQDMAGDLALLKATTPIPPRFRPMPLLADGVRRGSAVAAFGFPLGDTLGDNLKFTSGAVSALPDEANNGMYLLDVRINPGNSGGPLCDQRGNVVGMISAKTGSVGVEDSYGLAIPSPAIARFLDQHLPPAASRPLADTSPSPLTWELVDERVSSGVLKVVKKKP